MSQKTFSSKRSSHETSVPVLRVALVRQLDEWIVAQGDIAFPCAPSMLDAYMARLSGLWEMLGKPFSADDNAKLRDIIEKTMLEGYRSFPQGKVIVSYQKRPDLPGINYTIRLKQLTMAELYEGWVSEGKPPPFGRLPDAKVMAVAAALGDPKATPVLDIGAGTGRNAFPLARLGHPVDALEPTPVLANVMRTAIETEGLFVKVIESDILSSNVKLDRADYKLVVLAEVISHFRGVEQVRALFEKLAGILLPGGLVVVSTFLTTDGYKPDALARETSEIAWSYLFTRADLKFIVEELPFDRLSDESVQDYEKEHLPEGEWPPTGWFASWAQAGNVFALPAGKAPAELRWLVFRRRS